MTRFNTIIFDLGGVLVDWSPAYVFNENYFDSIGKRDYFLSQICTLDWNEQQDAGYPVAKAVEEKVTAFPEWEKDIRVYYDRWPEMLKGPIDETVELFRRLKKNTGLNFYALTNWSAELFPVALERFDFLHWFDGRVVSGAEKMRKPFPEFYQVLLDRYSVNPVEAIFIDDNLRNVTAAENLGITSIHFQNADQLEKRLVELQVNF
ncbi:MAG: HAD family phosphatase [Chitinophagaceae bacterium]|nr:HAD family phosphatase [Chitinophagaceae bacterium]MBL0272686.1 HAD family phosphatase [Chitinophagaceae bacterium]